MALAVRVATLEEGVCPQGGRKEKENDYENRKEGEEKEADM